MKSPAVGRAAPHAHAHAHAHALAWPVQEGHSYPVYCLEIVGTQNAHNLISICTDGRLCSWNLDMLTDPQEKLELQLGPGSLCCNVGTTGHSPAANALCRHGPLGGGHLLVLPHGRPQQLYCGLRGRHGVPGTGEAAQVRAWQRLMGGGCG